MATDSSATIIGQNSGKSVCVGDMRSDWESLRRATASESAVTDMRLEADGTITVPAHARKQEPCHA